MSYPLADLLKIRCLREDEALRAVRAAESVLSAAVGEAEQKKLRLIDYKAWVCGEIECRYQGIMGKTMSLKDMDAFKIGLAELEAEEEKLKDQLRKAEDYVNEARRSLESARDAGSVAAKARQKIDHHRQMWLAEEAREQNRLEDLELEEHSDPMRRL